MGYFSNRKENMSKAIAHTNDMDNRYDVEIHHSVALTTIFDNVITNITNIPIKNDLYKTNLCVVKLDSVSAIMNLPEKPCVLNFASFKDPGGKYLEGSMAQEECLCHASILYNVLRYFANDYYVINKQFLNYGLYANRCLYSKDIIFEQDYKKCFCDVITCAAPFARTHIKYFSNKYNNKKEAKDTVASVYYDRVDFVLGVANLNNVQNLILGAFGCGVFGNDSLSSAYAFERLLNTKYKGCFKNVIFAIPDDKNYNIFKKVLMED